MGATTLDEVKRQFPQHVLDRRDDVARLLDEAVAAGDKKSASVYQKMLSGYDKTISEYGFKRNA